MNVSKSLLIAGLILQATALLAPSAEAGIVDPQTLAPGATVNPLPNGYSGPPIDTIVSSVAFNFSAMNGPAGMINEYINQFTGPPNPAAPYGSDLHFAFEIQLTSGDIASYSAPGYASLDVSVKQCAIAGCSALAGNGDVAATSASRTSDGSNITFYFDPTQMTDTAHSGNLQIFTNATSYTDPFATITDSDGDRFQVAVVAPAVPEASTWAMLLLGFTGVGFVTYRRKLKPALMVA